MLDAAGALQARYDYDLYGQQTVLAETSAASFGFTGHFQHRPSGLYLTWFRAFDPRLGRWLSRDPLGEPAGLNLYAYVGNDPINLMDPLGLKDGLTTFLEVVNDGAAGFADTITFGGTKKLRKAIYGPCDYVNPKSWSYATGRVGGEIWLYYAGNAALAKGVQAYSAAKAARSAQAVAAATKVGAGGETVAYFEVGSRPTMEAAEALGDVASESGVMRGVSGVVDVAEAEAAGTASAAALAAAARYNAAWAAFRAWLAAGGCAADLATKLEAMDMLRRAFNLGFFP